MENTDIHLFPRATSQVAILVWIFGDCREEVPECALDDGAVRIFLSTKGKNTEEVSTELRDFLHYLEHTTDTVADAAGSERIRRIHRRVRKVKSSEEIGVKYMQAWEERYYDRQEAPEEGRAEGIAQVVRALIERFMHPSFAV